MTRVTPAQQRAINQCAQDVTIIIGGIDETVPRVRLDVCERLVGKGLLRWRAASSFYEVAEFSLTEAGQALVKK